MTLTTREAVEEALYAMVREYYYSIGEDAAKTKAAARLLCEHYGFNLSQFFSDEVDK